MTTTTTKNEPERVTLKPTMNPETGEPHVVRHPNDLNNPLPLEGRPVFLDSYWIRRLRDKSVERVELQGAEAAPKKAKS